MPSDFAPDGGIFSSEPFLLTTAAVFYPGKSPVIETVRIGGSHYRVLIIGKQAVGRIRGFYFYYDPVEGPAAGPDTPGIFLAMASQRLVFAQDPPRPGRRLGLSVAPAIRFAGFESYRDYLGSRGQLERKSQTRDLERLQRKLGRERGETIIEFDDRRPEALEALFRWKSAQSKREGWTDVHAAPRIQDFYRELQAAGLLKVSTLSTGGALAASSAFLTHGSRVHFKSTAYNPDFADYSPGSMLFTQRIAAAFAAGTEEIDLGHGDLPNKRPWATHLRLFGPVGARPARERVQLAVTRPAGRMLATVRRTVREHRGRSDG